MGVDGGLGGWGEDSPPYDTYTGMCRPTWLGFRVPVLQQAFCIRVDRVLNMRCNIGSFKSLVEKPIPGYNF